MNWTVNGVSVEVLDGTDNTWQTAPIKKKLQLAGTSTTETHVLGYTPPHRKASILITIANAAVYGTLLTAYQNGTNVTLVDEGGSYSALVEQMELRRLYQDDTYQYQGTVVFERAQR